MNAVSRFFFTRCLPPLAPPISLHTHTHMRTQARTHTHTHTHTHAHTHTRTHTLSLPLFTQENGVTWLMSNIHFPLPVRTIIKENKQTKTRKTWTKLTADIHCIQTENVLWPTCIIVWPYSQWLTEEKQIFATKSLCGQNSVWRNGGMYPSGWSRGTDDKDVLNPLRRNAW